MNKLISAMVMASVLLFGAVGIQAQTDPAGTTQTTDQKQTKKHHKKGGKHHKKAAKETKAPEEQPAAK